MSSSMKRTVPRRALSKRRVVNVQSLQMMLRSGVVRRADSMPPFPLKQVRLQGSDEQPRAACKKEVVKEVVQEQGWLSRVIFGPKPHPALTKRSSLDGGR